MVIRPWAPTAKANFLIEISVGNKTTMSVFGAFGWLASVSDSKVMAQKPFFGKKIFFSFFA